MSQLKLALQQALGRLFEEYIQHMVKCKLLKDASHNNNLLQQKNVCNRRIVFLIILHPLHLLLDRSVVPH